MKDDTLWMNRRTGTAMLVGLLALGAGHAMATTPREQRAIVQSGNGGPEVLSLQTVPVAEPGAGEVLIRIYAASVNPTDWKLRQGDGTAPAGAVVKVIPGRDVAGVIEQTGPGVSAYKVGDKVFALVGAGGRKALNGGYAEYVVAPVNDIARKPARATFQEAAALGVTGGTAVRLLDMLNITSGQRVFIDGVAGGVGTAMTQVAKWRGAYVIGTASARHAAYLKSIGVNEVIDYRSVQFEQVIRPPVDIVVEAVSAETAVRALSILKKGGVLVSIAGAPTAQQCAAAGVRCPDGGHTSQARNSGQLLTQVAQLFDAGKLGVYIDKSYPLERAAEAQETNRTGSTQGKIVLDVVPDRTRTK